MGYVTYFTLKLKTYNSQFKELEELEDELVDLVIEDFRNKYADAEFAINEIGDCNNDCNWYDHVDDLQEFSKKYPEIVFELYGDGENTEDFWYKYFKNGKVQYCPVEFVFPDFDISQLV